MRASDTRVGEWGTARRKDKLGNMERLVEREKLSGFETRGRSVSSAHGLNVDGKERIREGLRITASWREVEEWRRGGSARAWKGGSKKKRVRRRKKEKQVESKGVETEGSSSLGEDLRCAREE